MKQLSGETVRLLSSAQVITSVLNAVKELIENSLDAGADNIEVKLDNFGLDKIEVRDNGGGIAPEDIGVMGQRHFTSKLTDIGDLARVTSYGFRGEALASLCAVSDVTVTTKRNMDNISRIHTLNHKGEVTSSKPSHLGNGATITATHLFKTVPVRRQYYSSSNRKKDELKKIEDLLMCYGYINPEVRFALSHNKKIVWQKNRVQSSRIALLNTVGSSVMSQMDIVEREDEDTGIKVSGFLPKLGSDLQLVGRHHSNDRCWIYVNKRPVQLKDVEKLIKQHFCKSLSDGTSVRNLVACLHLELPTEKVDVNLEPDKSKVLIQNRDAFTELLSEILEEFYSSNGNNNKTVPKTDAIKNSNTDNVCEEQKEQGEAAADMNEEQTMENGFNQTNGKSVERVKKFGSTGDIRGQLREESKQTIESFLFKELSNCSVKFDDVDQYDNDSSGTNEIAVSEEGRKLKPRRSSLDHPRENMGLINGRTVSSEKSWNLEVEMDFPDDSRHEWSHIRREHATEENNILSAHDDLYEQQKGSPNQFNEGSLLGDEDDLLDQIEKEAGEGRDQGHTIGSNDKPKTNGVVPDEPTFTLFEENIFLDTQRVAKESDGDKIPNEIELETEERHTTRGKLAIDLQEDGDRESLHQSSKREGVLEGRLHSPEVDSSSSVGSNENGLVITKASGMAWSKGVLLGSKATPMEPVKVLVPGMSGLEDGQSKLYAGQHNGSVGMESCSTGIKDNSVGVVVRGNLEENSTCPPLPTLQTNSANNPPSNSLVETLNSTGDTPIAPQHSMKDKYHETGVSSTNHDKIVSSSLCENSVTADGASQSSIKTLAKSLLDKKGNSIENPTSMSPKSYYDLVNGTPLKKPQDAYTHFLKDYGPKVGECFPTIETESMDVLLKETWRELPEEKKKEYEAMAEKDQERYDQHVTDSVPAKRQKTLDGEIPIQNPTKKKKGRKVPLITNQGFIDDMLASQENRQAAFIESSEVIPTKEIPFSINSLKNSMQEPRHDRDDDTTSLVGRLASHHIWITFNQSHLSVLHHLRAEEVVLYRRLMASHMLASTALDVPLVLTENLLGCWSNWLTLLSMKSSPVSDNFISIYTDERLIKNGFKVRRLIDQETRDVRLEIISMSDHIPCYGIADLEEILNKVSKNAAVRLGQCRPLKVTNYLKSEAVRISRNRPSVLIQDDIVDLISSLAKISQHPITCLHAKKVFYNFFSLKEQTLPKSV